MGPGVDHTDIGAYALGLLEPDERRRVGAHLAQCPRCQAELPELSPVVAAIRTVPPDLAESVLEPPTDDGPPPAALADLILRRAAKDRHRRRRDILVAATIGGVVLAGGLAIGPGVVHDDSTSDQFAQPAADTGDRGDTAVEAAPTALRWTATDPVSGVSGTVTMAPASWGTSVRLRLTNVQGSLECELVAATASGEQIVAGWSVPPSGYGVPGSSQPLTVEGSIASPPDDISRLDVRTSDGRTLVAIPT